MSCTKTRTIRISLPVEPAARASGWPFLRWLDWMLAWGVFCRMLYRRQRGRRELLELKDHLLDDIGLTREQARKIATKPFWR